MPSKIQDSKVKIQKSSSPMTMAELLASHKSTFISPQKGQVLEGVITKLTSGEILVDIGAKAVALVLEKDRNIMRSLLSSLKIGDKVTVSVLNPESDFGNPVVSLRRFNDVRLWERLEQMQKDKQQIETLVEESTRGGFLLATNDGISGFLPNSQVIFSSNNQNLVGTTIKVVVIELNRGLKKVIFSQKATQGSEVFEKATENLKIGNKTEGLISNVMPFGIFVHLNLDSENQVEGFIHISEVSWEKLAIVPESFQPGEKIEVKIIGFDKEAKRVNLSLKQLTENPFAAKLKAYKVDQKVSGSVAKVLATGVIVTLEDGVEGFIKKDKIPPTVSYKEGSAVEVTIVEVDEKKQRLALVPVLTVKPLMYR
jgi:small subunit ribosomal protein S1